jgi:hypothetical protein
MFVEYLLYVKHLAAQLVLAEIDLLGSRRISYCFLVTKKEDKGNSSEDCGEYIIVLSGNPFQGSLET